MQKKSDEISEAMRLARTPAGQQLLAMLQKNDSGQMQKAMMEANAGNYQSAANSIQSLLSSPEAQKLLKELGK